MAIFLSEHVIKAMGYKKYPQDDVLEVEFAIIRIFSVRGITFHPDSKIQQSEIVTFGHNCTAVFSQSVNEACKILVGDVYADNEEEWMSEKKGVGPFILIYFKEKIYRKLCGGYRQVIDDHIDVYDAFPEGEDEIKYWESNSLPSIVTSLTVHLSSLDKLVTLLPVDKSIFGTTREGEMLFDKKIRTKAELYTSFPINIDSINCSLNNSNTLYSKINPDSGRLIYTALNETDKLKQFLNYYLFIERFTLSEFKKLNYVDNSKGLYSIPDRLNNSFIKFFKGHFNEVKNPAQKFHWCALLEWSHIDDHDVEKFLEMKRLRDKISHGENINEASLPVGEIKMLSLKLLGTGKT